MLVLGPLFVLLSLTSAAPLLRRAPALGFTPGATITPASCTTSNSYSANLCPARLPSRNILITARHQVVSSSPIEVNTVVQTPHNGLSAGFTHNGSEIRTYAIFSNLSDAFAGKLCRFHFITDGGVNLQPQTVIDHWNVYAVTSGDAVFNETTWATQPTLDMAPVAQFVTDTQKAVSVRPGQGPEKSSHSFLDRKDFECPTSDVAWVVGPAGVAPQGVDAPSMFVGGQNGLAIEVLESSDKSGWP